VIPEPVGTAGDATRSAAMLIDCETCVARDKACGDCVINVLLRSRAQNTSTSSAPVELDADEEAAIGHLAAAGLVPPLRLVRGTSAGTQDPQRGIA
jgi:hypothetical protein